jgi:exodeoxyribonuclease VII small subunit
MAYNKSWLKKIKKIDFESSLEELENIVAKLEDENINLEDSVKSFERGVNLVKECQKQLQTAELKIKKLLDDGSASEIDNE